MVGRALSDGGDPVTFDGEFYQVTELTPAAAFMYLLPPGESISDATLSLWDTKSCPPSARRSRSGDLPRPTSELEVESPSRAAPAR
jgi:hypothetical protein